MRGGVPLGARIGALALAASSVAAAATAAVGPLEGLRDALLPQRSSPSKPARGKHKPRRHGAKLRANRLHMSKRAKRRHRRARK